jgi:NAD-dependent DNA ligase
MDVKGKTVVVTGVLAAMQRDVAEAGLTSLGARVTGSVSASTDILFVGAQPGSKLEKAKALGITILDEAQLLAVLGNKTVSRAKLEARAEAEEERRRLEAQALAGKAAAPSSLKDKTVVVTGTLSVERDEMEELLRRAGARVTSSISKHTDFLVVGASAGSKLAKANALGVTTLSEAQARDALGGAKPAAKKGTSPAKKATRSATKAPKKAAKTHKKKVARKSK